MNKMFASKTFPSFYIQMAEKRIEKYNGENGIFNFYSDILFWQNFGLNFKDASFSGILKESNDLFDKVKKIIKSFENLFKEFYKYDELLSKEGTNTDVNKNFLAYILSIIVDILNNYSNAYVSEEKFNYEEIICKQLKKNGLKADLIRIFLGNLYSKIGFAYMNFKGEFIWTDTYTQMLFECESLLRKNIYSLLTPFSEFLLRNKFGNSIFKTAEQKPYEIIKYSIFTNQIANKEKEFCEGESEIPDQIFNYLNCTKTLTSRISKIILMSNSTLDESNNVVILLQTRLARKRHNFDEYTHLNFSKNFDN